MGIRFQCHHCGHQLHVKDFQAGKKGRCPACNGPFRIPQSDAEFSLDRSNDESNNASSSFPVGQLSKGEATIGQSAVGQSAAGVAGKNSSTAVSVASRLPSTKPAMAKTKPNEVSPSERQVGGDPAELPASSDVDAIQPQVISEAPDATWYVRPASGGQYGPAPATVVWQWLIEDRIGHDSLVWREDWPEWLPATKVFSQYFLDDSSSLPSRVSTSQQPTDEVIAQEPAATVSSAATSGAPVSVAVGALSPRELRKRNRRMKYSVVIAVLAVILVSLAIGLIVVLYQQGVLG